MEIESTAYYLQILRTIDAQHISVTPWEAEFIDSLLKRDPALLSEKQIAVVLRMQERYLSEDARQISLFDPQPPLQMFDDPDGDDIPF